MSQKIKEILAYLEFAMTLDLSGSRLEFKDEQGRIIKIDIGDKDG